MNDDKKKEDQVIDTPKKRPFAEIISAPQIDLSEAILKANLEKNKVVPVTEILTVYKKL